MIIPRHKICDICSEEVGINKRYFIIKSKNYIVGYAGGCSDNKTHHICEDCMHRFISASEDMEFAEWVTKMIFDNQVKDFDFEMFSELACRKLEKMGLVEKTESEWKMSNLYARIQYKRCKVFNDGKGGIRIHEVYKNNQAVSCCLGAKTEPTEWGDICEECKSCPKWINDVIGGNDNE